MRNRVVAATPEDGEEMLELIESASAKGNIELIYTRRPDAYLSYAREGDEMTIGLIKDAKAGIVAQAACVLRSYWINGQQHACGYVGGIRKKTSYKGLINWGAVSAFIQGANCDLFYCSILSANSAALDLFTKKRSYIPELFPVCEFTTYIINPKVIRPPHKMARARSAETVFRAITVQDLPKVIAFLNEEGKAYQFAPVVTDLAKEFSGLHLEDCYLLEDHGVILAFGALWDQRDYKQYIVTRYQGPMNLFQKFSGLLEKLGYIALPKENETLAFPTLTLFYAKDNDQALYRLFLYRIAQVISQDFRMFIIGMSSRDPNRPIYEKLRTVRFNSKLYYVRHQADITLEPDRPIHLECGLL